MDEFVANYQHRVFGEDFEGFSLFEFSENSAYKKKYWALLLLYIWNLICTPFLLVGRSVLVYLVPCLSVALQSAICNCFAWCGVLNYCKYKDKDFPPNLESLGINDGRQTFIDWVRLSDMTLDDHKVCVLFDGKTEPSDIAQGQLGDCWLLAAFATLCEKPSFLLNCFVTRVFSHRGKYVVRLYDKSKGRFVLITVDDFIPCDRRTGKPIFTHLVKNEVWPLILEKAYAKFMGNYGKMEGGNPIVALKTLTGYSGDTLQSDIDNFDDTMFKKLQYLHNQGCLMAAGSKGEDKTLDTGRAKGGGIQAGHAYSILDMKTPTLTQHNVRLLKLRNPWGTFEWDGDWSDSSKLWQTHPGVALTLGKPDNVDNGVFYMSWEDFKKHFDMVNVLYPDYGVNDLHYTVHNCDGHCLTCAPCCGLLSGCSYFWCACKGLRVLWLTVDSDELKKHNHSKGGNHYNNLGTGVV